jgi:Flp pilus assembly protein TadG
MTAVAPPFRRMQQRLRRDRRGVAVIEMAWIAPFLILVIMACIDVGRAVSQSIELTHAVRAGAQYSITASDSQSGIVAAVKAALPAKFSAATVTTTCYCGALPAGNTGMPPVMASCDTACPVGSARMSRIQAEVPFKAQSFWVGPMVATTLGISKVSGNVTLRYQ